MANLTAVKIFPPIGIARLGNSPERFIGPELPFPAPPPVPSDGHYKDPQCRIRRQAQSFRLWGYFDDGSNRELTAADGAIQWTVHLANAKAVFQGEGGGLIDPGPRTLNGPNDSATFANGTYSISGVDVEVPLGDAETDQNGRLMVAGGFGFSSSPIGNALTGGFWSNSGWHDDVSDGPVNATITVGGQVFQAAGAWVICPPPRYAPSTYSAITLYDTIRQVAINQNMLPQPGQPSFVNDIWPILTRAQGMLRVAAADFGPGDHGSMAMVIPPGAGQDVARMAIFNKLSPPPGPGNVGKPNLPANMPLLNSGFGLGADPADIPPTLRQFQYDQMTSWSQNNFVNDWPPVAPTTITPNGLTQAALENCVGAPFYPGIEATVSVNDGSLTYVEAFRLNQSTMKPGDVTQGMARPWQADFTACTSSDSPDSPAWWPAARPYSVYPSGSNAPVDWTRGIVTSAQDMVDNWSRLGFIVDPGNGQPVETERTVVCKDCIVVIERNEIGKEEAVGLFNTGQPILDGFFVIIEGFAPSALGINSANPSAAQLQALFPTLVTLSPNPTQMSANINDMLLEDNNALGSAQRVTFGYNIVFTGSNDFTNAVVPIQVNAAIQGVASSGTIDLTPIDSPYMDHGPISWLSNDTRVFKLQPQGSVAGVTLQNDPIAFIQALLAKLRTQTTPAEILQNYQTFENLPATESGADLEWLPTLNNQPVWNFALCRIRYRATTTPANDVRVFFRLFQTAATGTEYNPATTYRVGGQPGVKIPLLGIQGGELVTIPFFAEARKAANVNLNMQTDDTNKQTIGAAGGAEAYMYFGCWLDINQPLDMRFPIQPAPPDGGPFTGTPESIANLIRGTHQCMVAEINFDPDPITPTGVSTAATQKLSQRNLAIDHSDNPGAVDTHRVQHTFAIHPTTSTPAAGQGPDELMIAWGKVPPGTPAAIYLPGVRASQVLDLAARRFNLQTLTRIDDHTLGCKTAGVTYLPIPAGGALDLAGLITLDLPETVRTGELFRIVLRQVVDAPAPVAPRGTPVNIARSRGRAARSVNAPAAAAPAHRHPARHILGAFQLSLLVKTAREMLPGDQRTLSALRRVFAAVPVENRWYPVLQRYISQLTTRIGAVGGTGDGGPRPHPHPEGGGHPESRREYEGKVAGLAFDRFGDFEGFWLDTEEGTRHFASREANVEQVAREAWEERVTVLVAAERDDHGDRKALRSIVLLRASLGPSRADR